jgi:hypothetical protein
MSGIVENRSPQTKQIACGDRRLPLTVSIRARLFAH